MRSSKQALPLMICAAAIVVVLMAHTTSAQNSPNDFVDDHNTVCAALGLDPVSWDNTVAAYAENYANQHVGDCQMIHSKGPYGENLFKGGTGGDWTTQSAINLWLSEQQYFDYDSNTYAEGKACGHYTQMVWVDSTSIGCARAVCDDGGVFITCNYSPRGNIVGHKPY